MSDSEQDKHAETVVGASTVTVHRSVRYSRFLVAGGILGVLAALVLTFAFPANADFSRIQVFGFLALVCVAGGVAVGSVAALIVDRALGRRQATLIADRLGPDATPDSRVQGDETNS